MSTPFLMMTSTEPPRNRDNLGLSYEQHMSRNINNKSSSEPVIKKQRASSSKSTKSKSQAENKKAQRGMGIDKLERLRLEDRLKKLNPVQFNQTQTQPSLSSSVFPFGHNGNYNNDSDDNGCMNLEQFLMYNKRSGNGFFNGSGRVLDPRYGNVMETSARELSSIQKMQCVPDVSFKKKRVNAEDSGLTSEEIKNYCESSWNGRNRHVDYSHGLNQYGNNNGFINNADHFRNFNRSTAFTRVGTHQNKETRAIHRNEGSSMGGGGNILMEYDFLPSIKKPEFSDSPIINEDFGAAAANNDTSIDLSLKL